MDYREIENRLARNREMLTEREYARMTQAILEATKPCRPSLFARLRAWLGELRRQETQPQPCLPMNPQT
ncbi:MAG: hypothetical protein LCI00_19810 [Chloroflexi bacterium]|nr:hypothetical protein [Chloroflexota bacterium]MCC6891353.1 hypothetical protein [Anaerolineae bacterium]